MRQWSKMRGYCVPQEELLSEAIVFVPKTRWARTCLRYLSFEAPATTTFITHHTHNGSTNSSIDHCIHALGVGGVISTLYCAPLSMNAPHMHQCTLVRALCAGRLASLCTKSSEWTLYTFANQTWFHWNDNATRIAASKSTIGGVWQKDAGHCQVSNSLGQFRTVADSCWSAWLSLGDGLRQPSPWQLGTQSASLNFCCAIVKSVFYVCIQFTTIRAYSQYDSIMKTFSLAFFCFLFTDLQYLFDTLKVSSVTHWRETLCFDLC